MVEQMRWIADGYDRYNARQAFDLNLLLNAVATATALLAEIPELYAFLKFRTDSDHRVLRPDLHGRPRGQARRSTCASTTTPATPS